MDTISYNSDDLENLIIKNKEYYDKRRKKLILILVPILLVLAIAVIIVLLIIFKSKFINEIICQYQTKEDEKFIH